MAANRFIPSARILPGLAAAIAALAPAGVRAQTRTAVFAVRANVAADCQITARDLDFRTYGGNAAATASATLSLTCTPASAASISLDGGSEVPEARSRTIGRSVYRLLAVTQPRPSVPASEYADRITVQVEF